MRKSGRVLHWVRITLCLCAMAIIPVAGRADTPSSLLRLQLTTERGCLESGGPATFTVGESIIFFFGVSSPTVDRANATLFSVKPNGSVAIFGLGPIITNATYGFVGRVGGPIGIHTLGLKASGGGATSRRSCSFNVVDSSATRTPSSTRTATFIPTPTRTPTVDLRSPTVTPPRAIRPRITTNRGCQETGEQPVFRIGETITLIFAVDSNVASLARTTIYDVLADGRVNLIPIGTILTNRTYQLRARVAPPTGQEVLRLRASAGALTATSSECSFSVVTVASRTRTPTRTARPTKTRAAASPTTTPTPTPS